MGRLLFFVFLILSNLAFSYTYGFIGEYKGRYIFFGKNYTAIIKKGGIIDYGMFEERLCLNALCRERVEKRYADIFIFKGNASYKLKSYGNYLLYSDKGYSVLISTKNGNLEKTFILEEKADVKNIRIRVRGIDYMHIDEEGNLVLLKGETEIKISKPVAFQYRNGKKHFINAEFYIYDKNIYGFKVESYDKSKKLFIDPVTNYKVLGGSGSESAMRVFISPYNGDVYLIGYTASPDFPIPLERRGYMKSNTDNVSWDILIIRLSRDLRKVKGIAIIGGSNEEWARAGAIDKEGYIYVCGWTVSKDFPVKGRQFGKYNPKSSKAFLLKLSPDLKELVRSFRLGGSNYEYAYDMFIDKEGYVYVAGETSSPDFPVTKEAYDKVFNGGSIDIFIVKFDKDLENIVASTYVGGKDGDAPLGIYVDERYVYIAGLTWSYDFPVTEKAFDKTFGGVIDGIAVKLKKDLSELVASTYIGGLLADNTGAVAVDRGGNIYIGGKTFSWDMPFRKDGYKPVISDFRFQDAYIIKLSPDFSMVKGFTYLGGYGDDAISNIIIKENGNLIVGGSTTSYDFPITVDLRRGSSISKKPQYDIYIVELSGDLRILYNSIIFGGSKNDSLKYFVFDGDKFILAGSTYSEDFFNDVNINGINDLFVFEYKPEKGFLNYPLPFIVLTLLFWSVIVTIIIIYLKS